MKKTAISIKIDPQVKQQAQKVAHELGLNLSSLINAYLKEVIRTQKIQFSLQDEREPSDRLKEAIAEAEEDHKHKRTKTFDSWEEEQAFLESVITDGKAKRKKS